MWKRCGSAIGACFAIAERIIGRALRLCSARRRVLPLAGRGRRRAGGEAPLGRSGPSRAARRLYGAARCRRHQSRPRATSASPWCMSPRWSKGPCSASSRFSTTRALPNGQGRPVSNDAVSRRSPPRPIAPTATRRFLARRLEEARGPAHAGVRHRDPGRPALGQGERSVLQPLGRRTGRQPAGDSGRLCRRSAAGEPRGRELPSRPCHRGLGLEAAAPPGGRLLVAAPAAASGQHHRRLHQPRPHSLGYRFRVSRRARRIRRPPAGRRRRELARARRAYRHAQLDAEGRRPGRGPAALLHLARHRLAALPGGGAGARQRQQRHGPGCGFRLPAVPAQEAEPRRPNIRAERHAQARPGAASSRASATRSWKRREEEGPLSAGPVLSAGARPGRDEDEPLVERQRPKAKPGQARRQSRPGDPRPGARRRIRAAGPRPAAAAGQGPQRPAGQRGVPGEERPAAGIGAPGFRGARPDREGAPRAGGDALRAGARTRHQDEPRGGPRRRRRPFHERGLGAHRRRPRPQRHRHRAAQPQPRGRGPARAAGLGGIRAHGGEARPRAGQGHRRLAGHRRSGPHAPSADRRHHRLGQVGGDQHHDPVADLPPAARALQIHHGRSQDARAFGL